MSFVENLLKVVNYLHILCCKKSVTHFKPFSNYFQIYFIIFIYKVSLVYTKLQTRLKDRLQENVKRNAKFLIVEVCYFLYTL